MKVPFRQSVPQRFITPFHMTEAELKAYIEQGKAHGMTVQQMREALVGAGWSAVIVDAALGLSAPAAPAIPAPPAPPVVAPVSAVPPASPVASAPSAPTTVLYATFWRKFFASVLDGFLAGVPLMIVIGLYAVLQFVAAAAADGGGSSVAGSGILRLILGIGGFGSLIWFMIYRPWLEGKKGATWGMRILGLKIILEDEPTKAGIGFWLSFGRAIVSMLAAGITAHISFFWMLMDPRRREVADLICKTVVLHDPQKQFVFSSLEQIPARQKRTVWFAILALLGAMSILGAIGGAFTGSR